MQIKNVYKIWMSSIFLIAFFIFNIFITYQSFYNSTANTHSTFLQLGITILLYFLSIITLVQYFFFREVTYYYYVWYLLLHLCYFTLIFSYFSKKPEQEIIPHFVFLRPMLSIIVLVSAYAVYTQFAIVFLNLKNKDSILYKGLRILLKVYLFLLFIICISYLIPFGNYFSDLVRTIVLSSCIPLGIIGIILIFTKAKNTFGLILSVGSSLIFVGSVFGFLFSFQILQYPINIFPFNNWLFYTMAGCVLEVIIFFSSFAYRNKILVREEQFAKDKLQFVRDEISRDLHDDVGASLSNINILNELAKRNANNPLKANEYLLKAGEDIQHVSESLNDIVWNINSKYDDLDNLFIRMKRYAGDMLDGKNIAYKIEFPDKFDDLKLGMDKRKDLYFIFKEAINNLVKYSGALYVEVSITIEKKILMLVIKDNGKGFAKEKITKGNGLDNMLHRATAWGAILNIDSEENKGTTVFLEMELN
jgi:signal transduction histidine kinase